MAYEIDIQNNIQSEIIRIIQEQCDSIITTISDDNIDLDEKVHSSRKSLKRIRAVYRLIRKDIGKEKYRDGNRYFRDIGRRMSEMRDARVYINTLTNLEAGFRETGRDKSFTSIRYEMLREYDRVKENFLDNNTLNQVLDEVTAGKNQVEKLQLQKQDFSKLKKGIRKVFRRGNVALYIAISDPQPEHVHEFRKRVKYLWYHFQLLMQLWPPVMDGYEDALDDLSDYLGDEHDLSNIYAWIDQRKDHFPENESKPILEFVLQEKTKLQQASWPIGEKMYRETAKSFADRLENYWDAHMKYA